MTNLCKGNHQLEVIYSAGYSQEIEVVRWCAYCGAIVIDIDCDNRINPGAIMKMKLPEVSKTWLN
jgi:hypothetical protein